jgi:hypothetical protein
MRFSFANRAREIQQLVHFLETGASDVDRICLVSGPSGIGKSRLVDEAVDSVASQMRHVRVNIRQSDFRCGESGFFLRTCATAVAEACKQNDWGESLEGYARRRGGLAVVRSAAGAIPKTIEKLAIGHSEASVDLISAWRKNSSTLKDLLGEPSAPALRLASGYLEKVLSDVKYVLILENAQFIDPESLHYIYVLLDKCQALRLVCEYTTNTHSGNPSSRYREYRELQEACIEHNFGVLEVPVGRLDFEILALKNFQADDARFVEVLRLELQTSEGNVRDVERLHELASKRGLDSLGSTTIEATLVGFSTAQKIVLWIIALARRRLDPYELAQIAAFVPASLRPLAPVDVAKTVAPFVELRQGTFWIDHDSLLERLYSIPSIRRECLVAASAATEYYRAFLERSEFVQYSEYEILFALLSLSRPLNSAHLVEFALSRLSDRTRTSGRPGSLLRLVDEFAKGVPSHVGQHGIIKRLIQIIYDACWIEGAIHLTEAYRDESPEIRLCHCHALAISGRHDEAEAELAMLDAATEGMELSSAKRMRVDFYAGLVGALVARVAGQYEVARRRYLNLNKDDLAWPEDKCLYYRFGEVADVSDAAERLELAVGIGQELENPIEIVRAAVSLAMIRAECGRMDEANILLDKADSFGETSYVDSYMSANNRLVVDLLSGTRSLARYDALQEVLPLVIESMDRVLITNNLMAAAILLGDIGSASKFCQHLEEYLWRVVEPNMRRLSYYNCSRFYAIQGSAELAAEYMSRAFEPRIAFDGKYWQARRAGSKDITIDFRLSCEFDLPMMSNWYFRWPDFEATPE